MKLIKTNLFVVLLSVLCILSSCKTGSKIEKGTFFDKAKGNVDSANQNNNNQIAKKKVVDFNKCRVLTLTDITNEPDDEESMVRHLIYSNEYEIEGLIATTSTWLRKNIREDRIHDAIDAYAQVYKNLEIHADGFASPEYLHSITKSGLNTWNMDAVGDGKNTDGTDHIKSVLLKDDPRPVYIGIWGGANSLAQALWDLKKELSESEMNKVIAQMRVYDIGGQDNAGAWITKTWPTITYFHSDIQFHGLSHRYDKKNAHKYKIGDLSYCSQEWIDEHVQSHGPLGKYYPDPKYSLEGDSPSFMYTIRNGLSDPEKWWHGGWAGRFDKEKSKNNRGMGRTPPTQSKYDDYYMYNSASDIWTYKGTTYTEDDAELVPIARWRPAFQNDFAARMDWTITSKYENANHNPKAVCNGSEGFEYIEIEAKAGATVKLDASGSSDPDGDAILYHWYQYKDPGTYKGSINIKNANSPRSSIVIPSDAESSELHIILEVKDTGVPTLNNYRRVIINVASRASKNER